jgi:TRAP-type uncharacterized transport system substrate-binding protein
MKPLKATLWMAAMLLCLAISPAKAQAPAIADPDLIVSVSSLTGTYGQMAQQVQKVCSTPSIGIQETPGTPKALEGLLNNKFEVAFLTTSVLWGKKQIENDPNVDSLKVLMPLYNSEMHTIALRSNGNVNQFSDVGNKRVGAYGGAIVSARILMSKAQLAPALWKEFGSEADGIAALTGLGKDGQPMKGGPTIDVLFVEQGQPAAFLANANGNQFKLLPFDKMNLLQGFGGFYQAALNYSNLGASGLPTVATSVSLVTYNYEDPDISRKIMSLKDCITQNLVKLRSTRGNHAKWREVKAGAPSAWPMFSAKVTAAPRAKK